jgi:hypothetical protein
MPRTPKRAGDAGPEAAQDSASQETTPPPAQESAGAPPAQEPTHQGETAASASLAGLRGAAYVQALAGQPSATLQVPLLPTERRGDWERAKGQKIPVTSRQLHPQNGSGTSRLEGEHALAALIVELQRPGATRFDQIDLNGSPTRSAIDRLSDYLQQARLRAQVQTGKKWNATHLYLVPVEDA